ncbi:MAG: KH domain-containing protein [Nanoarchaeota archaeon]
METLYFKKVKELQNEKERLERRLEVKINIQGKKVTIEGDSFKEYEALMILEAMQFGFSANKALTLMDEQIVFRKIPIKSFTRRKNLTEVRGRIIGKEGKTKRTIEDISGCDLAINDGEIGIIGPAEQIEEATTAITNLIRGTKQANVYRFLERINTGKKDLSTDLGLKIKNKR